MVETGEADGRRLAERYGIARGPLGTFARKTWKIMARLAGTRLIREAVEEPVAFSAIRDGRAALLRRQLATPRAAMETGETST